MVVGAHRCAPVGRDTEREGAHGWRFRQPWRGWGGV